MAPSHEPKIVSLKRYEKHIAHVEHPIFLFDALANIVVTANGALAKIVGWADKSRVQGLPMFDGLVPKRQHNGRLWKDSFIEHQKTWGETGKPSQIVFEMVDATANVLLIRGVVSLYRLKEYPKDRVMFEVQVEEASGKGSFADVDASSESMSDLLDAVDIAETHSASTSLPLKDIDEEVPIEITDSHLRSSRAPSDASDLSLHERNDSNDSQNSIHSNHSTSSANARSTTIPTSHSAAPAPAPAPAPASLATHSSSSSSSRPSRRRNSRGSRRSSHDERDREKLLSSSSSSSSPSKGGTDDNIIHSASSHASISSLISGEKETATVQKIRILRELFDKMTVDYSVSGPMVAEVKTAISAVDGSYEKEFEQLRTSVRVLRTRTMEDKKQSEKRIEALESSLEGVTESLARAKAEARKMAVSLNASNSKATELQKQMLDRIESAMSLLTQFAGVTDPFVDPARLSFIQIMNDALAETDVSRGVKKRSSSRASQSITEMEELGYGHHSGHSGHHSFGGDGTSSIEASAGHSARHADEDVSSKTSSVSMPHGGPISGLRLGTEPRSVSPVPEHFRTSVDFRPH